MQTAIVILFGMSNSFYKQKVSRFYKQKYFTQDKKRFIMIFINTTYQCISTLLKNLINKNFFINKKSQDFINKNALHKTKRGL